MPTHRELTSRTSTKKPLSKKLDGQSKLEECMNRLEGVKLASPQQEEEDTIVHETFAEPAAVLEPFEASTLPELVKADFPAPQERELLARSKEQQLCLLGLGPEHLSDGGKQCLQAIAGVSEHLGLVTTDKAAVLAAVVELRQQQWAAEDSQVGVEEVSRKVQGQMEALRQHAARLGEVAEQTAEQQASRALQLEDKQRKKVLNDAKADNYVEELSKLQTKLNKLGFRPELRHEALAGRAAALSAKNAEIEELERKLAFFKDLPADAEAANQIYAHKHARLLEATRQFEAGLAQL